MAARISIRRRTIRRSRWRQAVEGVVGALIAVLVAGTWLVERFVVPSGSMAETLLGNHLRLACDDCRREFFCGADSATMPGKRALCPNCGRIGPELATAATIDGDRLLVARSAFAVRSPRRWELAAFRNPDSASQMLVKRVAGLPHETIEIRHGDVFADGVIQRKTLAELRAMAILVHDADCQPQRTSQLPPRWQGDADETRWRSEGGRFFCPPSARQGDEANSTDWLSYRHWRRKPGSPEEADETAITDQYGYNQTQPVVASYPVRDLLLSCRIRVSGAGAVSFFLTDGQSQFLLDWQVEHRRLVLTSAGTPVAEAGDLPPVRSGGSRLELALVDQQVVLALDGRVVLSHAYRPAEAPFHPSSRPIAVGSQGAEIELSELKLFRDIYYTPPRADSPAPGNGLAATRQYRLAADEYFLLGDNSPLAADSRELFGRGGVPGELLIGKPWMVYLPSSRTTGKQGGFQVPDLARIRYIH